MYLVIDAGKVLPAIYLVCGEGPFPIEATGPDIRYYLLRH